MVEDQVADIPQVSNEENAILVASFTDEEVFNAISGMEHNKSPGPDGFPTEVYQTFWEVIKTDLLAMFG
jgi:hypothetical protein